MAASFAVVLLAAGNSTRFVNRDKKPFADLDGRAVWLRSLELFSIRDDVKQILIAVAAQDRDLFDRRYRANVAFLDAAKVVDGGVERVDSVQNALSALRPGIDFVAVHDTARPCLTTALIDSVFDAAVEHGAAALATPVVDTVKRANAENEIQATVPREGLWLVQTPQVFRTDLLIDAYANRSRIPAPITDDAQLVEALGRKVVLVKSSSTNIKLTTAEDLALAAAILKGRPDAKPKSFHPFADEKMW